MNHEVRKLKVKDKYRENIDKSEWREVNRYDIMNGFEHLP